MPGLIDTEPLLTEAKSDAARQVTGTEGDAWRLVAKETWDLLYSWYGGGPAIERPAIEGETSGIRFRTPAPQSRVFRLTRVT